MNRRNYRRGTGAVKRDGAGDGRRTETRSVGPSRRVQELDHEREIARTRQAGGGLEWKKIDLHLHTPASSDYRDPGISYLDILKKAEEKGIDMIAFADHNTVAGYSAMHREMETLTLLERLGRVTDVERETLSEYRRLLAKIVVLPGFEFTATFGFHILGIFPENTSVRKLEYLLLNLNVPEEKMLIGAPDAGSTSDVLNAYQSIAAAGGLAIAAHANSSNGVAMQGFPFGGQTKIAYTQDLNLAALEVTDMEVTGRRTTASFYNGSKPEYPRRMHILQGSDAHSLNTEQSDSMNKRLGVGARITEVLVKDASFASLKELLTSNDFTRIRPYRQGATWEFVEEARQEGQTLTQSFHERAISRTSRTRPILHDIVAFSNAEGGTIYIGANSDTSVPVHGIEHPEEAIRMLKEDIRRTIEPPVEPTFTNRGSAERGVLVIAVPKGGDAPYAFTPTGQIYIRLETESVVANRDEIVSLVLQASRSGMARVSAQPQGAPRATQLVPSEAGEQHPEAARPVVRGPAQAADSTPLIRESSRQESPRSDLRPSATPAEPHQPQAERIKREGDQRPPSPAVPVPPPAAERRAMRPPVFSNLPPEKLKGQIRPMMPSGAAAEASHADEIRTQEAQAQQTPPLDMPTPVAAETVEAQAPEALPATLDQELELVPVAVPTAPEVEEPKTAGRSGRSRSRRGRGAADEAPAKEVVQAESPAEAATEAPTPLLEAPAEEETKKPSRSRSRRKSEVQPAAAAALDQPGTPMETTVSAEHLTREEIVEAQPEQLTRGKSRASRRHDKQREIDAPTAAAAETEAAAQAILVEAEVEPGAQIPAEVEATAAEPEMTSPPATPAKKGRSRRGSSSKSDAQQAAEATEMTKDGAEETPAVQAIEPTQEQGTKKGRGRSRSSAGQAKEQPEAPAATRVAIEGPNTGVEIINTEERNGQKFHTMRDLRDGTTVHNVTRKSARRLWYYAILQHEHGDPAFAEIAWHPNETIGLWRREHRAGASRYDLVARYPDSSLRIFYGVTDEGLSGPWRELVQMAADAEYWGPPPVEK